MEITFRPVDVREKNVKKQVLPYKVLTPKDSKRLSHDEIAPLEVSMTFEDADDESGRVKS